MSCMGFCLCFLLFSLVVSGKYFKLMKSNTVRSYRSWSWRWCLFCLIFCQKSSHEPRVGEVETKPCEEFHAFAVAWMLLSKHQNSFWKPGLVLHTWWLQLLKKLRLENCKSKGQHGQQSKTLSQKIKEEEGAAVAENQSQLWAISKWDQLRPLQGNWVMEFHTTSALSPEWSIIKAHHLHASVLVRPFVAVINTMENNLKRGKHCLGSSFHRIWIQGWQDPLLWAWGKTDIVETRACGIGCLPLGYQEA